MNPDFFEARLKAGDIALFDQIKSYSSPGDRRAWLGLQTAARAHFGTYSYLEIGSAAGGSIQPYWLDPACQRIFSIDLRPDAVPDARGFIFDYGDNSEQRMLDNLLAIDPAAASKIVCFRQDSRDIDPVAIAPAPQLCFIDGQHTDDAVLSDFEFCRRVMNRDGAIYFHDADAIFRAIAAVLRNLKRAGVPFTARKLGGQTFAIFFGDFQAAAVRVHGMNPSIYAVDRSLRNTLRAVLPGPAIAFARRWRT